jgi:anti-sigma factor RsiW
MNVDCEQAANLIFARIDDELAAADEAALDAHLAECAACRATLEAAALQDAAMVRAFASGRDAAAALARRVEHQVSTFAPAPLVAAAAPDRVRHGLTRWAGWMAAAAAGFVVAVIVTRPSNPSPTAQWTQPQISVQPAVQAADPIAHLAFTSGEVFACPSDDKPWQPIAPGDALAPGAKVRTADAAKCELTLPGGSRLRLNSGTELRLAAARDVHLAGGQIFSAVAPDAAPLRIAAGDANVTTAGRAAQLDVARVADAATATVTVVAGAAQVNDGQGKAATTVRGGESLRVCATPAGVDPLPTFACEPVDDPLKATRWLDDLLVLLPPDDPELLTRVDALLTRIVAERSKRTVTPGPIESDVRARGVAWAAPIARYALNHLSAPSDADRAKRRAAARLLADLAPSSCIGDLIPLLADEDGEVRFHTAAALNRLTGQTLGFSPDQCAATPRDDAPVVAWRNWWAANRAQHPARR